jgi:hypothetical protein
VVSAPYPSPHRRALEFIARSPHGCTEQELRSEGFGIMTLVHMVRAGLVVTNTHMDENGRTQQRFTITDLGRQLIEE